MNISPANLLEDIRKIKQDHVTSTEQIVGIQKVEKLIIDAMKPKEIKRSQNMKEYWMAARAAGFKNLAPYRQFLLRQK